MPPSRDDFEVVGVFNPGAVRVGRRGRAAGPGGRAAPRAAAGVHRPAAVGPGRGPDDRLGPRRRAGADRSAGGPAQGRRAGPAHLHLAPAGRPLRRRAGRPGGHGRHVPPADGAGGVRRRGPADHPARTAGSISPTSPSRGTARRRPWRPRPTSARSSGTGSSSAPRTRTWSCSRSRSAGPSRRCTGRSAATPFTPAGDVGRPVAGPDPLGPARRPRTAAGGEWQTGRVGAGPPPIRVAGRLAGDLPRQPPPDPAGRGRGVLRRARSCSTRTTRPGSSGGPRSRSSCPRPTSRSPASCRTSSSRPGWSQDGETLLVYYGAADAFTAVAEFSRAGAARAR